MLNSHIYINAKYYHLLEVPLLCILTHCTSVLIFNLEKTLNWLTRSRKAIRISQRSLIPSCLYFICENHLWELVIIQRICTYQYVYSTSNSFFFFFNLNAVFMLRQVKDPLFSICWEQGVPFMDTQSYHHINLSALSSHSYKLIML